LSSSYGQKRSLAGSETFLHADARRRCCVFAPAVDLAEAGVAIQGDGVRRVAAGLEYQALRAELPGRRFEAGEHGPADAPASPIRFDVHALYFGRQAVGQSDGPAADGPAILARHQERPAALFEMLRLQIRPEALLRRVQLGQAGVQRRDQTLRIRRLECLSAD